MTNAIIADLDSILDSTLSIEGIGDDIVEEYANNFIKAYKILVATVESEVEQNNLSPNFIERFRLGVSEVKDDALRQCLNNVTDIMII